MSRDDLFAAIWGQRAVFGGAGMVRWGHESGGVGSAVTVKSVGLDLGCSLEEVFEAGSDDVDNSIATEGNICQEVLDGLWCSGTVFYRRMLGQRGRNVKVGFVPSSCARIELKTS